MLNKTFCRNFTLEEILSNYKDTTLYQNADEAFKDFCADYEEELSAQEGEFTRNQTEGEASCSLNDYYAEHGYKTRYVLQDRHVDYDRDTFIDVIYVDNDADAIEEGKKAWSKLTAHERKDRVIEVMLGKFDDRGNQTEDGIVDILWSSEKSDE